MRIYSASFFLLVCVASITHSQSNENDTVFPDLKSTSLKESAVWREDSIRRVNPMVPGVGSMVFPGAGQVMTGHYVKAGFLLALESLFVGQAIYWHADADLRDKDMNRRLDFSMAGWHAQDSATRYSNRIDSALYREEATVLHHSAMDTRFSSYNFTVWAVGAHIYNILDAVNSSNYFKNTEPRNPGKAALLAAVPGLGLGQLYNGSISKAGMVIMTQFSLGSMAWNSHRLMRNAEQNYARLYSSKADTLTKLVQPNYRDDWSSLRYRAFTNRNMYMWYSIFFYFYGMFDATVDAYLHDYPGKMKIEPDLGINEKEIRFSLYTTF
jgi:hypothetical protein